MDIVGVRISERMFKVSKERKNIKNKILSIH